MMVSIRFRHTYSGHHSRENQYSQCSWACERAHHGAYLVQHHRRTHGFYGKLHFVISRQYAGNTYPHPSITRSTSGMVPFDSFDLFFRLMIIRALPLFYCRHIIYSSASFTLVSHNYSTRTVLVHCSQTSLSTALIVCTSGH